jgi:outer membrane protein OmpA-like peptidoglycan-associated protein
MAAVEAVADRPGASYPDSDIDVLRALLLASERSELRAIAHRLAEIEVSALPRAQLEQATSEILAKAFKSAESRDHRALARAVAPLIVAVIQSEIRNSKEVMVEALYPITGRLVSASVAAAVREAMAGLNARIENLTSFGGLKLKLRSILLRRPVSELALASLSHARAVRILLLERGTGRILAIWDGENPGRAPSELVAGLIAAVTEFAASTSGPSRSELRTLDLGSHRTYLRQSPMTIIAAECVGPAQPAQEQALDDAFADLIERQESGAVIEAADLEALAGALTEAGVPKRQTKSRIATSLSMLIGSIAAGLTLWFCWSTMADWRIATRVQGELASALASRPDLAGFSVKAEVDHRARHVVLSGLVPSDAAARTLREALTAAAAPYPVVVRLGFVVEKTSFDRRLGALEDLSFRQSASERVLDARLMTAVEQTAALARSLNAVLDTVSSGQREQTAKSDDVVRKADLAHQHLVEQVSRLMRSAEILQAHMVAPRSRLASLLRDNQIFFVADVQLLDEDASLRLIGDIVALAKASKASLQIIGQTDENGARNTNAKIALRRAEKIRDLMIQAGSDPQTLTIVSRPSDMFLDDDADRRSQRARRVIVELAPENAPR